MTDQWTMQRLVGFVGQGPARAMCLAAETYTGADATGLGFVQRLAEPADLLDDTLAWADTIATLAPLTIAGFKVGLNEAEELDRLDPDLPRRVRGGLGQRRPAGGPAAFARAPPARVPRPLTSPGAHLPELVPRETRRSRSGSSSKLEPLLGDCPGPSR